MRGGVLALCAAFTVAGCGGGAPLVSAVHVAPEAITPDADGQADVARISYRIAAPARVTITLTGADGQPHVLRDQQPRQAGQYDALFGGVVDGSMLPDGEYTVRVAADPVGSGPPAAAASVPLTVTSGDAAPPVLHDFMVDRPAFTPNQDGLGDEVHVSYRLDEAVADLRLWLENTAGEHITDILQEKEAADDPTAAGAHDYRFDAGVEADAPPPPNGDYRLVAEARDDVGNVSRQELPLTIADGGQPRVALKADVDWSDKVLPLGATLYFTATVQNVGDTPIRTRGPEPGFVYDNNQSFNQVAPAAILLLARHGDQAASIEVPADHGDVGGADLDLPPALAEGGAAGPYPAPVRPFATGEPLALLPTAAARGTPVSAGSDRIRVCGTIRDGGLPVAGAEVFAFESDGDNGVRAVTGPDGAYCFQDWAVPPPTERTFARSPGAMRLGLEYDEDRTNLGYPFRWQLGRTADLDVCSAGDRLYLCLPPNATVQVTGGVRFVEQPFRRQTNVYLSLLHEDVRDIQAGYGRQQLTVEY